MGRVCFASSQLARRPLLAARFATTRPLDVEVNYLLGRYWLNAKISTAPRLLSPAGGRLPRTRHLLHYETPLVSFYLLARPFQSAEDYKAAAAKYNQFLETAALPVPGYRYSDPRAQ